MRHHFSFLLLLGSIASGLAAPLGSPRLPILSRDVQPQEQPSTPILDEPRPQGFLPTETERLAPRLRLQKLARRAGKNGGPSDLAPDSPTLGPTAPRITNSDRTPLPTRAGNQAGNQVTNFKELQGLVKTSPFAGPIPEPRLRVTAPFRRTLLPKPKLDDIQEETPSEVDPINNSRKPLKLFPTINTTPRPPRGSSLANFKNSQQTKRPPPRPSRRLSQEFEARKI